MNVRVIPCLLLKDRGLVKTTRFERPRYVGDPINAVKIFNEKEADELFFLDISATIEGRPPDWDLLKDIASECFMPFSYGGGIKTCDDIKKVLKIGAEKVVINSQAFENPLLIKEASQIFGSQSIVVSLDVRKMGNDQYKLVYCQGKKSAGMAPVDFARQVEDMGAGEVMVHSIDRDGTMSGYDLDLVKRISRAVSIPTVACGGAGSLEDFRRAAMEGGASAVAAGSFFIFHGRHRAVLITYPSRLELDGLFKR